MTGRVRNQGGETTTEAIYLHAELLGADNNPVAKKIKSLNSIEAGGTTNYLIRFDGMDDLKWSGKYRLRFGNYDQKVFSGWDEFSATNKTNK